MFNSNLIGYHKLLKKGEYSRRVWELAKKIPKGRVTTYGLLAVAAGGTPILARSITHILSKCPQEDSIPWHRIVYSSGKVWLSPEYEKVRRKLYKNEGIKLDKNNRIINFEKVIYYF